MDQATAPEPRLFAGTAAFIKHHLIPVNTVIAFSVFMVAGLDFLKPLAPGLVLAIYSATGILALALLLAGVMPARVAGLTEEAALPGGKPRRLTRMGARHRPARPHHPLRLVLARQGGG